MGNLERIVSNSSTRPCWLPDPETVDELERRFAPDRPRRIVPQQRPHAPEKHIPARPDHSVDIVLYISANSLNCGRATSALQSLLAQFPQDGVRLRIVDMAHDVESAIEDRVLFTPTLIVTDGQQRKTRVLGDLSNLTVLWEVLVAAGIEPL